MNVLKVVVLLIFLSELGEIRDISVVLFDEVLNVKWWIV